MTEARYYEKLPDGKVHCLLCPHECGISPGKSGKCHVRINRDGTLFAGTYGSISSLALDPVEKKPFAHFYPGSCILSAGSFGCNLSCGFCQNHEISQIDGSENGLPDSERLSPDELVEKACNLKDRGNIGLAYTYNEPLVSWEYVFDTACLARKSRLKNVLVTNGFINSAPLAEILPFIDAINIDLKAFTDSFYRKICGGKLEPVLETIKTAYPACHVELTTLVIPGFNSSPVEIDALAAWVASVSPEIPLHLNRHHPDYRMAEPAPMPVSELFALSEVARRHLKFVHCGNLPLPV